MTGCCTHQLTAQDQVNKVRQHSSTGHWGLSGAALGHWGLSGLHYKGRSGEEGEKRGAGAAAHNTPAPLPVAPVDPSSVHCRHLHR